MSDTQSQSVIAWQEFSESFKATVQKNADPRKAPGRLMTLHVRHEARPDEEMVIRLDRRGRMPVLAVCAAMETPQGTTSLTLDWEDDIWSSPDSYVDQALAYVYPGLRYMRDTGKATAFPDAIVHFGIWTMTTRVSTTQSWGRQVRIRMKGVESLDLILRHIQEPGSGMVEEDLAQMSWAGRLAMPADLRKLWEEESLAIARAFMSEYLEEGTQVTRDPVTSSHGRAREDIVTSDLLARNLLPMAKKRAETPISDPDDIAFVRKSLGYVTGVLNGVTPGASGVVFVLENLTSLTIRQGYQSMELDITPAFQYYAMTYPAFADMIFEVPEMARIGSLLDPESGHSLFHVETYAPGPSGIHPEHHAIGIWFGMKPMRGGREEIESWFAAQGDAVKSIWAGPSKRALAPAS